MSTSVSVNKKLTVNDREVSLLELDAKTMVFVSRFCYVVRKKGIGELRLTDKNLLRKLYAIGINTKDRSIKKLFLNIHKEVSSTVKAFNNAKAVAKRHKASHYLITLPKLSNQISNELS